MKFQFAFNYVRQAFCVVGMLASLVWYVSTGWYSVGEINGYGIILHPISLQSEDKALKLDTDTLSTL